MGELPIAEIWNKMTPEERRFWVLEKGEELFSDSVQHPFETL
jgi:hypothetical protein